LPVIVESKQKSKYKHVLPSILLLGFLTLYLYRDDWISFVVGNYPDQIKIISLIDQGLLFALLTLGGWTFLTMMQRFFWQGIVEKRRQKPVPDLLLGIFSFVVVSSTLVMVLIIVFRVSPLMVSLLIAGIASLTAVFFRDFLTELLAGLSINLDDSLKLGSDVRLPDGSSGVIEQVSWRSVQLRQTDESIIIIPNSLFSNAIIQNLDTQSDKESIEMEITLDFSIPIDRGVRVLGAALNTCVASGVLLPGPRAIAFEPGAYGIVYRLCGSFARQTSSELSARTMMVSQVMKHLKATGLAISLPKQNLFLGEVRTAAMDWQNSEDRQALIANIGLFSVLEQNELIMLADSIQLHTVKSGTAIIKEGDSSTSMYGLAEGLLQVSITRNGEEDLNIAQMEPGEFFGEMSMLADEPRSATITAIVDSLVYELSRESFNEVICQRIEITESISRLIAERQLSNETLLHSISEQEREAALQDATLSMMDRIKSVFTNLIKDNSKSKRNTEDKII